MYPTLTIIPGREISITSHHPWIFSGSLTRPTQDIKSGAIVSVTNNRGDIVATGTYSARSLIAVRVLEFGDTVIDQELFRIRIANADRRRRLLGFGTDKDTTAYRVVFGEVDYLPGLTVDRYGDVIVFQLSTAGMENLRNMVVGALTELYDPPIIYERSDLPARLEEGLEFVSSFRRGDGPGLTRFLENGRHYIADYKSGQKTGFFLDQRDLRQEIFHLASGRKTLDLFSYSGGGGIAAMAGGATEVSFVDASRGALELCHKNIELNGIDPSRAQVEYGDIFQWIGARSTPEYDMVLLDPPALIKSRRHADAGRKGYHFLNRAAMRILNDGGILVTSSCSAFFTEEDFAITLRRAAEQAGVEINLLKSVRQSPDHPLSLTFPESFYLKSFICEIRRKSSG